MQNPDKNISRPSTTGKETHREEQPLPFESTFPCTWGPIAGPPGNSPRLILAHLTQFCHMVAPKEVKLKTKLKSPEGGIGKKGVTLLAASTLAQTASMAARSSNLFCFFSFALLDFLCNREKQSWLKGLWSTKGLTFPLRNGRVCPCIHRPGLSSRNFQSWLPYTCWAAKDPRVF